MDRGQQDATASLLFREGQTIAEILQAYRELVVIATERVSNRASIGQAAHNSMAMQLETQRLIKGVENLLALTRRIRELWIVGPLRKAEEGGRQTEETIEGEVQTVTNILNQLRANTRQQYVTAGGGYGQYIVGPLQQPTVATGPSQAPANASSNGTSPQVNGAA